MCEKRISALRDIALFIRQNPGFDARAAVDGSPLRDDPWVQIAAEDMVHNTWLVDAWVHDIAVIEERRRARERA